MQFAFCCGVMPVNAVLDFLEGRGVKGWVYIISNKAMPEMIKVGYSTKDPKERANELGTGSPYAYQVEYEVLVDNPRKIEKLSHDILSFVNEGKEWFRCDISIALRAIKKACVGEKVYFEYPSVDDKKSEATLKAADSSKKAISKSTSVVKKSRINLELELDIKELETDELIRIADQGNADAQYELAQRYDSGNRTRKSLKDAFRYFLAAAEQGHTLAQLAVGKAYQQGRGTDKNVRQALDYLKIVAEKGNPEAQYLFGCEVSFLDLAEDKQLLGLRSKWCKNKSSREFSLEFVQLAANQDYAPAQDELGDHYSIIGDYKKSFELYKLAAEKSLPKAQRHLADCYLNGYGCEKNIENAKHWYNLAANGKDSVAKKKIENWEWYAQF